LKGKIKLDGILSFSPLEYPLAVVALLFASWDNINLRKSLDLLFDKIRWRIWFLRPDVYFGVDWGEEGRGVIVVVKRGKDGSFRVLETREVEKP